jgi:exosortase/archaeosortase family protein
LSEKVICLTLAALPVTIFKNALRILTISWFSAHFNLRFMTVLLHNCEGIPFSLLVFFGSGFSHYIARLT